MKNVGILIFDDVEVLDFAGPFEVFSVASELYNHSLFNVFTVAHTINTVTAVNGLFVHPHFSYSDAPTIDILIIAGGVGTRLAMADKATMDWVKKVHAETELTVSICSGARLLGKLGLLDNTPYCTHKGVYEHMIELVPTGKPQKDKRFTGHGKIFSSGGISAGIDLSFHIVEILCGQEVANVTADYMEYYRHYDSNS
jgi:transcriptional regulator GlxA family with amidase domain